MNTDLRDNLRLLLHFEEQKRSLSLSHSPHYSHFQNHGKEKRDLAPEMCRLMIDDMVFMRWPETVCVRSTDQVREKSLL